MTLRAWLRRKLGLDDDPERSLVLSDQALEKTVREVRETMTTLERIAAEEGIVLRRRRVG